MADDDHRSELRDEDSLREHFGEPSANAMVMNRSYLDEHHQLFVRHSPFICIASASADGQPNVSPRGDAPGFVHIHDDRTLVIPDRPGNNKIETFVNVVDNPKVALIFFIPGIRETVRVHGTAELVRDPQWLELGRVEDKLPTAALVVRVTRAYLHCGKAIVRAKLWDSSRHVAPGVIPSFGQIIKDQAQVSTSLAELQAALERMYRDELY
ncbi:MAG: pyridoxamine 5'-phosphate oxidase family protein [Myxococcales bacterium]|nr:pyridoxamine 5'-phosphate oxidase family protein [Myxococcales bacterium]